MTARYPKAMGEVSARVHGARRAMEERAASALAASRADGLDERAAAALRGKAQAYREAAQAITALETGTALPRRIEKTGLAA